MGTGKQQLLIDDLHLLRRFKIVGPERGWVRKQTPSVRKVGYHLIVVKILLDETIRGQERGQ